MRHQVKKIKLGQGNDYNQMTVRQMANNFVIYGKLTTTRPRAKILKSVIDRLVEKSKEKKESNLNYLKRHLANEKVIKILLEKIGPKFVEDKLIGGYVRLINLTARESDGSVLARLEWSRPILTEEKKPVAAKK